MAKFLPIVQVQKDLRQKLSEAKLADYYERVLQGADSFNALWDAMRQHPTAQLIIRNEQSMPHEVYGDLHPRVLRAGEDAPTTTVVFITNEAMLQLVKEAKQVYALANELLHWMKEKKLDQ